MIDRARAGLLGGLLASTFLTGLPFAQAASVDVLGAPGIDGTDGTAATPDGGPGGPGGIADAIIPLSADADNAAVAVGGAGGKGGAGYRATPATPGSGGNGGAGGSGGAATASAVVDTTTTGSSTTVVEATGGAGGRGGYAGNSYPRPEEGGVPGSGGAGGTGGAADVSAAVAASETSATTITVTAQGGKGGAGFAASYLPSGIAGDGGPATASAAGVGGGDVTVTAAASGGAGGATSLWGLEPTGGNGGTAQLGAVSGRSTGGGTVSVSGSQQGGDAGASQSAGGRGTDSVVLDRVVGDTTGQLTLFQSARGGNGGPSDAPWYAGDDAGSGGDGGDAVSSLTNVSNSATVVGTSLAVGGKGGQATYFSGGNGGSATASLFLEAPGDVKATAESVGGDGGASIDGALGHGGLVTLGPVIGRSTGGGTVTVTGKATDGYYGGGVTVVNAVLGSTIGALILNQEARGNLGAPGWYQTPLATNGGNAVSALQQGPGDFAVLPASLVAETLAIGGQGGWDHNIYDGPGGSATAITDIVLTNVPGSAAATARGGDSGASGGGAKAVARTGGEMAKAEASGSNAWYAGFGRGVGGEADARAASSGEAYAAATAGSTGDGYGGGATAEAAANGNGSGPVLADSRAHAGSGAFQGMVSYIGSARSLAEATNRGGQTAEAFSSASGFSPMNGAHATSATTSIVVSVGAHTETTQHTEWFGGFLNFRTEGAAEARADFGSIVMPQLMNEPLAASTATALPDAADLAPHLAGNATLASAFPLGPSRTIAGWGLLAGDYQPKEGYFEEPVANRTLLNNRLEFTLDTAAFLAGGGVPGSLTFGLYNPAVAAAGFESLTFDILEDGLSILPGGLVSFTGPAEAFAYFDDRVLDLGAWTGAPWFQAGETTLDLAVVLSAAFDAEDQSFSTEMVFGIGAFGDGAQPVPLPAAAWLFAAGLAGLGLLGVRRRAV